MPMSLKLLRLVRLSLFGFIPAAWAVDGVMEIN